MSPAFINGKTGHSSQCLYLSGLQTQRLCKADNGNIELYNIFRGRILIRHASSGKKYLYKNVPFMRIRGIIGEMLLY